MTGEEEKGKGKSRGGKGNRDERGVEHVTEMERGNARGRGVRGRAVSKTGV